MAFSEDKLLSESFKLMMDSSGSFGDPITINFFLERQFIYF